MAVVQGATAAAPRAWQARKGEVAMPRGGLPGAAGALLLAAVLSGCGFLHREEVAIRVNGELMPVRGEVRYGRVYADALALARALGLRPVYFPDHPDRGFFLQSATRFVHLHTGRGDCHVGGQLVRSDAPTLYLDPRTRAPMAPVALVAESFGGKAVYRRADGQRPAEVDVSFP